MFGIFGKTREKRHSGIVQGDTFHHVMVFIGGASTLAKWALLAVHIEHIET